MRYGYFEDDNREYVIDRPDIPVSWTNYLGVKDLCTVISHNAGGYSFYKSTEHHRITRFRQNGIPLDRPGHYVYIRDDESMEFWTISWQPVGKDFTKAKYICRHGLSYSKFQCDYREIEAEQLLFIPLEDDVELWDVKIKNKSGKPRKLSIFTYLEFSFHHIEIDNQNLQMSLYAGGSNFSDGIIEYDFFYEPWTYHFFASNFTPDSYDCVRDSFIGNYRTETNPAAVEKGECSGSVELGGNHCGSLHKKIVLKAGESKRLIFMLGVGSREEKGKAVKQKYSDFKNVDTAFEDLRNYWEKKTSIFQCKTPHQGLNSMINIWTLYQAETCVVWSRIGSFIEVGGRVGLGYRDTSQDVMGVVHSNPEKTRYRIIQLLKGHTSLGYELHLVLPAYSKSDDDIGYITRVYKGIKENAAIFSHPNPWAVIAECKLGHGNRAMKFYYSILPYNQNDMIEIRQAEPYSYCQFVMGKDHTAHGRARHPWLTGSAAWFYTAVTKYILGIHPAYNGLEIDPCIPSDWSGFEVVRKWRGATYKIIVKNPDGIEKGVKSIFMNGKEVDGLIPIQSAGSLNKIEIVMGE